MFADRLIVFVIKQNLLRNSADYNEIKRVCCFLTPLHITSFLFEIASKSFTQAEEELKKKADFNQLLNSSVKSFFFMLKETAVTVLHISTQQPALKLISSSFCSPFLPFLLPAFFSSSYTQLHTHTHTHTHTPRLSLCLQHARAHTTHIHTHTHTHTHRLLFGFRRHWRQILWPFWGEC